MMDTGKAEADSRPEETNRQERDDTVDEHEQRPASPQHQQQEENASPPREESGGRTTHQSVRGGESGDLDKEERAYSRLEPVDAHDHYEETDGHGMSEAEGQALQNQTEQDHVQNEEALEGDDHDELREQDPLAQSIRSEPRITHTGSKYMDDSMAVDLGLQQSIAGYEVEAVHSIFKLFDHQNNGTIRVSDIGEILRCLTFNPTEAEVSEFVTEIAAGGTAVSVDALTPRIVELMESGKFQPAVEEEILAAFCTLDPDLSGLVTVKQLREALTTFGEPLTDEEFDDLVKFAPIDPQTGKVNYKEYAKELCATK